MGQPVVHFEIMGRDSQRLQSFYAETFGWEFDTSNAMGYAVVDRDANTGDGNRIGGGIGQAPDGYDGHATFYVAVPDVEAALAQVERRGGARMFGPEEVMDGLVVGLFTDPEGHVVGVVNGG
jgi:predicted enzyme related to lactoylglutathione lyase